LARFELWIALSSFELGFDCVNLDDHLSESKEKDAETMIRTALGARFHSIPFKVLGLERPALAQLKYGQSKQKKRGKGPRRRIDPDFQSNPIQSNRIHPNPTPPNCSISSRNPKKNKTNTIENRSWLIWMDGWMDGLRMDGWMDGLLWSVVRVFHPRPIKSEAIDCRVSSVECRVHT
jgi:hypothetical protein